ncbi:tetratricopeptide repeat protein [Actinoplanes derwentensis]|uniref:Tetratricopeptide repeat-containing protein n=1 Tax=Actinoplanes derwentensis TaxID=113562 RepID=A0A1H2D2G5_9ACTN|nr:tetratricopeptide repeat protein [Actinoplanes derwentensis]SDT76950.1 Tetratricopeptide repeat-containing protein [Actinoplanes derwentensis]
MDSPSARRDVARAREALDRGETVPAATHLAAALAHAPALPEIHELLGRLAARAGGGLDLFPVEPHATAGRLAARAHLLAAAGRPEEGLPLLAAASGSSPAHNWAGVPWVADPALGPRIDPGLLARTVMRLCTAVGDPAPATTVTSLRPFLTVVRHAVAAHGEHAMLLGAGSALARRLGDVRLAVEWAGRGARAQPSKLGEIWLGYAYRSAGRMPEALAALRRAVAYDPDDLSVYADVAATLADLGRLDEALRWTELALERDPTFDCVVHTAHRLRHRADGDVAHLVGLADFIRDHPDDAHEHTDLEECCRSTPWLSGLPAGAPLPAGRAPVNAQPSADALHRLQRVAGPSWPHPPGAYDRALGLVLVEPWELLALLAHPETARADQQTALEVWACLGLLHHGADEPWLESSRRRLLLGLLDGDVDRVTQGALFALVAYAWVDPEARADVAAVVAARLTETASGANARAVAELALAAPGLDRPTRELAAATIRVPTVPRQRGRGRSLLRWRRD